MSFCPEEQSPVAPQNTEEVLVITDAGQDRYHTFGYISWWEQETVRNATVMVVGAGALGNEVLKNLALMGVGRVLIVDFDTIEHANLSRSVLFRPGDNGRIKAQAAAEAVKALNPDVEVQWINGDISFDLGLGVFRRMDAIVGCLDNRLARFWINRYCYHLDMPWIDGGIDELLGEMRVFRPGEGACYECTFSELDYHIVNLRYSCPLLAKSNVLMGKVPTTPTISSIVAGFQTQEALKLLHRMTVQAGKSLVINGLTNEIYQSSLPVNPHCQSHWKWEQIIELPDCRAETTTLADLLQIARQHLGPDAMLDIADGSGNFEREYATHLECRHCKNQFPLGKVRYYITEEDVVCPECHQEGILITTPKIKGDEDFLDQPLATFGIPPLHILQGMNSDQEVFFELTGDAEHFFEFV